MCTLRFDRFAVPCALLTVGFITHSVVAAELWEVDFAAAKKAAAAEGKDVLMEFTGSDWCPPCMLLEAEVLSRDVFINEAPKYFALLKLDNPHNKTKQTSPEVEQYERLSKEYEVQSVPTVILADATGKPYAKVIGYGGGDAADYMAHLKNLQRVRVNRDENLVKTMGASGPEKARLLDAAIGGIDPELASTTYKPQVEEIIALDPDNRLGLRSKYELVLKTKEVKSRIEQTIRMPSGQVEAIDAVLAEFKPTGALRQQALIYKGWFLIHQDAAAGVKLLEEAINLDPTSQIARRFKVELERIKELK